jgi:hypothetical protein
LFPDGAYRAQATALLAARRTWLDERWSSREQPLALYVGREASVALTEQAARSSAIQRGQRLADTRCRDFAASGLHRFIAATVEAREWVCESAGDGVVCGFDGRAVCTLLERQQFEQESCGDRQAGEGLRR